MNKKITSLFLLISMMIILTACGNKDYKAALEKGYDYLEEQAYEDAYEQFTKALTFKKKEAAEKGQQTAETMKNGWEAYDEGEWDDAIEAANVILDDKSDDQSIKIVYDDATKLFEESESLRDLQTDLTERFDSVDSLISVKEYEEAKEILASIISIKSDHPVILEMIEQVKEKQKEVDELIKKQAEEQEKDNEEETTDNETEDNPEDDSDTNDDADDESNGSNDDNDSANNDDGNDDQSTTKGLSKDEATSILRNALQIPADVVVNVDHEDGPYYIIQVYEVVGSGEGSHTATWGWYKMHKTTGEWEKTM